MGSRGQGLEFGGSGFGHNWKTCETMRTPSEVKQCPKMTILVPNEYKMPKIDNPASTVDLEELGDSQDAVAPLPKVDKSVNF